MVHIFLNNIYSVWPKKKQNIDAKKKKYILLLE